MTWWRFSLIGMLAVAGFSLGVLGVHADAPAQTIIINDKGFIPATLTIPVGTTVIFKNEGSQPHWPASNFHPNHTLYPEKGGCIGSKLDACKGLKTGETFTFTFTKVGSWPMHDHLVPGLVTVIKVTGEEQPAATTPQLSRWQRFTNWFKGLFHRSKTTLPAAETFRALPYDQQLTAIREASQKNPLQTWQYLKSTFIVNGQVVGNVHEFAHIIGNAIYDTKGLKGITMCDDAFAYGCYHGVSEELLQEKGAAVIADIEKQCTTIFPPDKSMNYTGCIHGMGHGLYTWAAADTGKALAACDTLHQQYRPYCYDGVFMERAGEGTLVGEPSWQFCRSLAEPYQYNCARYQSQVFLQQYQGDTAQTARACQSGATDVMSRTCLESIGYFVAQRATGQEQAIAAICGKLSTVTARAYCTIGAGREVIFQQYQAWRETADQLCATLPAGSWQQQCRNSNQQTMKIYNRI